MCFYEFDIVKVRKLFGLECHHCKILKVFDGHPPFFCVSIETVFLNREDKLVSIMFHWLQISSN